LKEHLHVREARDCNAALANLAHAERVIRVVAHQRGQIERRGQARLTRLQELMKARVRLLRAAKTRELPHRPELAPVAARLESARVRKFTRHLEGRLHILGGVHGIRVNAAHAGKEKFALREFLQRSGVIVRQPS
jgi:hypothetical protein